MADYLTAALGGLGTATDDTPWGYAGQTLMNASPLLINRKNNNNQNLAAAFGAALLGGLIKYKGRQDAAEQTAEATSLAQQIQAASSPEEQLALAQSAESGGVRNKLTNLVNALQIQQSANEQSLAQKKAELQLALESEMSPLAKELRQMKLNDRIKEIDALYNNKQELQEAKGPTQAANKASSVEAIRTINNLANDFENLKLSSKDWNVEKEKSGTPANLAWSRLQNAYGLIAKLGGQDKISDVDTALARESVLGRNIKGFTISDTNAIAARLRGYLPRETALVVPISKESSSDQALIAAGFTRGPNGGWIRPGASNGR